MATGVRTGFTFCLVFLLKHTQKYFTKLFSSSVSFFLHLLSLSVLAEDLDKSQQTYMRAAQWEEQSSESFLSLPHVASLPPRHPCTVEYNSAAVQCSSLNIVRTASLHSVLVQCCLHCTKKSDYF